MPPESIKVLPVYYEINVSGRLTPEWAEWFNNMTVRAQPDGEGKPITTLFGPVTDQAELFGILNRIRDLGLRLVSVNIIQSEINQ